MLKTVSRKTITFCISLIIACAFNGTASAQQKCTNAGIAGTWVVKCSGYLTPAPDAPMVPATLLSKAVADKEGKWSSSGGTLSLGGTIVTQDVESVGPAQTNPDCTGSITYSQRINGQPGPNIHFNYIVGKHNNTIDGIGTDPGSVFSCTLTRVSE